MENNDISPLLPLLIYDGQCDFCYYWVRYWQQLTGNTVEYKPYQEVAQQYPTIPIAEFKRAVQYVAPNGEISSGAKASFLTMSHAAGKSFWIKLYRKLPGFAYISEKFYTLISTHRSFFYFLSILFWGRHLEPTRLNMVAWLFLRIFGLICFGAFVSFAVQALGLIGSHGLVPVAELTTSVWDQLGSIGYRLLPMVFWFNSSDVFIQSVCWTGAIISLFLVFNILPRISLLLIYILYLSLCCAGQAFMSFQWDVYLLETSIIGFFLVGNTHIGIWLLRWLLFRFMFAGGMVKILSGDPTWSNYTALYYYFNTEPLPTPIAWYMQQLPHSILKIGAVATLLVELVFVFLIFFPRRLRFIAAFAILWLQTTILLTGNYNFFNLLTMALCLTLFDDAAMSCIMPQRFIRWVSQHARKASPSKLLTIVASLFAVFTVSISLLQFNWRFADKQPPIPVSSILDSVAPFRLVNVYGPFAVMTKSRMEIVIEGSDDNEHWQEYAFKYKPGDVMRRPLWNIPHQPRLDWQMWFAALGSPNENPWFLRLLQRILENSPDVIALLEHNPFPNKPPIYVRAQFYEYNFTTKEEREKTGAWWKRELVWLYYPSVHLGN